MPPLTSLLANIQNMKKQAEAKKSSADQSMS